MVVTCVNLRFFYFKKCIATWHWQCHLSHTRTWHVAFFFSKN